MNVLAAWAAERVGEGMNSEIVGALESMRKETERAFLRAGIVGREVNISGCVGYEYTIPTTRGGAYVVRSVVSHPHEVGGRIGRKIKRKLKKAVKSRAFKALVKVAKGVASVVPGGAAVVTAATVAEKAAKAIKAAKQMAKRGDKRGLKMLPGALREGAAIIKRAV